MAKQPTGHDGCKFTPCTGSVIDGCARVVATTASGPSRLAPAQPAVISLSSDMPERLDALTVERDSLRARVAKLEGPIDMLLFCPNCLAQHIDEPHGEWTNPPHRSHECQECKHVWRPADLATNGVRELKTKGSADGEARPNVDARIHLLALKARQESTPERGVMVCARCPHEPHPFSVCTAQRFDTASACMCNCSLARKVIG